MALAARAADLILEDARATPVGKGWQQKAANEQGPVQVIDIERYP